MGSDLSPASGSHVLGDLRRARAHACHVTTARRSAAAAWLQDGQFAKAAEAAQKSLSAWPYDPLALLILAKANDGLGRREEARRYEGQAIGLWMGDLSKVNLATI